MTFMDKVYTLRTEVRGDGKTAYFISFADGQGEFYDLEVSEPFFCGILSNGAQKPQSATI